MARTSWRGGAAAVVQTEDFTPANVEVGDIFTITFFGEPKQDGSRESVAISFTATVNTVANVTAGLTTAINASTNALVSGVITATDNTTKLTLTADQAGVPFYTTASTTNVGGGVDNQTLTEASVTANAGPNDWNTAGNWSAAAVPSSSDDIKIVGDVDDGSHAILYGLLQTGVTPTSFKVAASFTAALGDNSDSAEADWKYLCFATGSTTNVAEIRTGGTVVLLRAGLNTLTVRAVRAGEHRYAGDINEIRSYNPVANFNARVITGSVLDEFYLLDATGQKWDIEESVTSFDRIDMNSGTLTNRSAFTAGTVLGGRLIHEQGAVTTLKVYAGGYVAWNADENLTTLETFSDLAIIDFTQSDANDATISTWVKSGGDMRTSGASVLVTISAEEDYGPGLSGGF